MLFCCEKQKTKSKRNLREKKRVCFESVSNGCRTHGREGITTDKEDMEAGMKSMSAKAEGWLVTLHLYSETE